MFKTDEAVKKILKMSIEDLRINTIPIPNGTGLREVEIQCSRYFWDYEFEDKTTEFWDSVNG